jgi:hypothetical protein
LTIYSDYGSPSGAGWYKEGTTAEVRIDPSQTSVETVPGKVREMFVGWSTGHKPASLTNYVDVTGPIVVLANWKEQYMLDISSAITSGSGSGWYDNGAVAKASVAQAIEAPDQGRKYSFKEWQVLSGSDQAISDKTYHTTEIVMNSPHTLAPQWNELYYVGVDSEIGNPTGQEYYSRGDIAMIAIDPIYETDPGKSRLILSGWEGLQLSAPTSNSLEIKVHEPIVLKPIWTEQHYVKVNSLYGMVEGSGWYDEGSPAILKLQTRSIDTGFGKKAEFVGWSSVMDSQNSQSGEYRIDSVQRPTEVNVVWSSNDATQLALIVSAFAAIGVTALFTVIINKRKKRNMPHDKGATYNWRVRS